MDSVLVRYMLASIVLTVVAELSFTRYSDVYGAANVVGHLLKLASFALIYRAVIVTGLAKPQEGLSTDHRLLFGTVKSVLRQSINPKFQS